MAPGRWVLISSSLSSDFVSFHRLSDAIEIEPIKGNFETEKLQISLASITLIVFMMSNNTRVSSGEFDRETVFLISLFEWECRLIWYLHIFHKI